MSGFDTTFKHWLNEKAGYLIYKGKKKKIEKIFFTSSAVANSDEMNFKLKGQILTKGDGIDFKELWKRFYKETGEKRPKKQKRIGQRFEIKGKVLYKKEGKKVVRKYKKSK
ncbi:hypothetical protein IPJ63_00240 [Candidatus Nomurabacteria bacterium]|nr:MAG: hypothetical protein IPJ63_00240 [Candidatus Nomurabacteria bacterium]